MSELHIEHLVASYGREPVLADVNLHVPSGSFTCILGPSGCGKTTLLRVVAGFEPARAGSVRVGERIVDDGRQRLPAERRNVGYVPQEGALFPHMTIGDNIGFSLPHRSRDARDRRRARVDELLELVGMPELAKRYPHQISGGQQQRVAVARALARRPDLVLLDEPFAALDAELRTRIRREIREVLRTAGVTALLVTHDRSEALSLGDQVAVMRNGCVAQTAPPSELYARPTDGYTAAIVGDVTLVASIVTNGVATTPLGQFAVDPRSPVSAGPGQLMLRPEQLHLAPSATEAGIDGGIEGTVTRVEFFGHDARIEMRLDTDRAGVDVVARVGGTTELVEGSVARVAVEAPVWVVPGSDAGPRPII